MSPPHLIRRQSLQVKLLGNESQGLQLQAHLSAYCRDWLNPALERLFEQMAPGAEHIRIERLSLELGKLDFCNWERDLTDQVVDQLRQTLQIIQAESATSTSIRTHSETAAVMLEAEQHLFSAFTQFLQTGLLCWPMRLESGQRLQTVVVAQLRQLSALEPALRQQLHATLRQTSASRRLQMQFNAEFRALLLLKAAPDLLEALIDIFAESKSAPGIDLKPDNTAPDADHAAATDTLLPLLLNDTALIDNFYVCWLSQSLHVGVDWRSVLLGSAIITNFKKTSSPEQPTPANRQLPAEPSTADTAKSAQSNAVTPAPTASDHRPESNALSQPAAKIDQAAAENVLTTSVSSGTTSFEQALSEGIYLDNAGLVLLHPFLPQLFAALEIVQNQSIVQPERALKLLHFLTTGQSTAPEYQLPLSKLLLDLPMHEAYATMSPLDQAAQDEGLALLRAVISHWQALRDTSPDGLRGSFLLRPGKLSRRGNGDWLLQVEQQGFDILLNQLPWGFSMVKLPWMPAMLWVEWSY